MYIIINTFNYVYNFLIVQPTFLKAIRFGNYKYVTANGIKFHCVTSGSKEKPLMLFLANSCSSMIAIESDCCWSTLYNDIVTMDR